MQHRIKPLQAHDITKGYFTHTSRTQDDHRIYLNRSVQQTQLQTTIEGPVTMMMIHHRFINPRYCFHGPSSDPSAPSTKGEVCSSSEYVPVIFLQ